MEVESPELWGQTNVNALDRVERGSTYKENDQTSFWYAILLIFLTLFLLIVTFGCWVCVFYLWKLNSMDTAPWDPDDWKADLPAPQPCRKTSSVQPLSRRSSQNSKPSVVLDLFTENADETTNLDCGPATSSIRTGTINESRSRTSHVFFSNSKTKLDFSDASHK